MTMSFMSRSSKGKLPKDKGQKTEKFWSAFRNKAKRRNVSGDQQASTKSSTTATSFSGMFRHASQKFSIRPRWPRRRLTHGNRREQCTSTSQGLSDDASVVWHSDSEDDGFFASHTSFGDEKTVGLNTVPISTVESMYTTSMEEDSHVPSSIDPNSSAHHESLRCDIPSSSTSDPLERLEALDGGVIFANRYRIAHERIPGNPNCRFATELKTSRRVFLKFYTEPSQPWKNAVRVYRHTQRSMFVCQLLDAIEDEEGFPPCLVFERGTYTLTRRLASRRTTIAEQRTILYAILEALEYLHSLNLTHGNLTPSKFMWFESDFSWKLVGLDYASFLDEPTTLLRSTSRYAAPEILRAIDKDITQIQRPSAVDMWSFGIMTFEILTGSSVRDALGVQEVVRKYMEELCVEEKTHKRTSISRKERHREEGMRFIHRLLRTDPTERQTVTGALEDIFFECAIDSNRDIDSQTSILSKSDVNFGKVCRWPEWTWVEIFNHHTSLTFEAEYFSNSTSADFPFNLREAETAERFYDDSLPGHPVHVLRLEQDTRFHLCITTQDTIPFSVEGLVAIRVAPPDSDFLELEAVQSRQNDALDIVALMQPSKFLSKKMCTKTPNFRFGERKYLKLAIQLRVLLGAPFRREVDLCYHIYCKIIHPRTRLRLRGRGERLGSKRRVIKDTTLQLIAGCC